MIGITGDKRKQKSCSIDSRVSCQRREKDHMDSINNIRQLGDFSGQPSCKQQMEVNITHSLCYAENFNGNHFSPYSKGLI